MRKSGFQLETDAKLIYLIMHVCVHDAFFSVSLVVQVTGRQLKTILHRFSGFPIQCLKFEGFATFQQFVTESMYGTFHYLSFLDGFLDVYICLRIGNSVANTDRMTFNQ